MTTLAESGVNRASDAAPAESDNPGRNVSDAKTTATRNGSFVRVCSLNELEKVVAVAARVNGVQIALVRLPDDRVLAVDHRDPRTGSCTMARGIVGSKNGEPTIAAPLFKEVYSLVTGQCLTNGQYRLLTHDVQIRSGDVFVQPRRPGVA